MATSIKRTTSQDIRPADVCVDSNILEHKKLCAGLADSVLATAANPEAEAPLKVRRAGRSEEDVGGRRNCSAQ